MSDAPAVEMLWEPRDPQEVLRDRFGLGSAGAASAWVHEVVTEQYGIEVGGCERLVMSAGNALAWVEGPTGPLIAKWSIDAERFPRLAAISELTAWLHDRGQPVAALLATPDARRQVEVDGVSLSLQRVIPGRHLDVERPVLVAEAGRVLAGLHDDLRCCPEQMVPPEAGTESWGPSASDTVRQRIITWLDADRSYLPAEALAGLRILVEAAPGDPGETQLVHGDYRAGNILTEQERINGVLDLEEMRPEHPVMELARSAVMLGTLFHDWGPVSASVHEAFRRGYESVRPLSAVEAAWWRPLVLWWSLLMVPPRDDATGWGRAALRLAGTTVTSTPAR